MITQKILTIKKPRGFHLITAEVLKVLDTMPQSGLLNIFCQHTSAGLTINENCDPSVRQDFETVFNKLVPENDSDYIHTAEGPDDMPAHIKSSLTGASISIPIMEGKLALGTWQGIYFCEFRNHASARKLLITIYE